MKKRNKILSYIIIGLLVLLTVTYVVAFSVYLINGCAPKYMEIAAIVECVVMFIAVLLTINQS